MPLKTPEEDKQDKEEATLSLAPAKEISVYFIFTLKEPKKEQPRRFFSADNKFLFCSLGSNVPWLNTTAHYDSPRGGDVWLKLLLPG